MVPPHVVATSKVQGKCLIQALMVKVRRKALFDAQGFTSMKENHSYTQLFTI